MGWSMAQKTPQNMPHNTPQTATWHRHAQGNLAAVCGAPKLLGQNVEAASVPHGVYIAPSGVEPAAPVDASVPLSGVVLAGGQSRRLGCDKRALRLFGDDAPNLLTHAALLLQNFCTPVYISVAQAEDALPDCSYAAARKALSPVRSPLPIAALPRIADAVQGAGAFGGVLSALRQSKGAVLAFSCDMPFLSVEFLERLVHAREKRRDGTLMTAYKANFLPEHTGSRRGAMPKVEALVAIYEKEALPYFEYSADHGLHKLAFAVPPERQEYVPYGQADARAFFNVNSEEDLQQANVFLQQQTTQRGATPWKK